MQFRIPQDVQREDKIVGPLTLRQLITVGVGGGIAYALYVTLAQKYFVEIWLPPVILVSLLTAAFAFLKIHDMTFGKFILYLAEYTMKPRKRVWKQMSGDVFVSAMTSRTETRADKKIDELGMNKREQLKRVQELSDIVDTMRPGVLQPPDTKIPVNS